MRYDGRSARGKVEASLERTRGVEDRIIIGMESVNVVWDLRVSMCRQRVMGVMSRRIECVVAESSVSVGVVGYHDAVGRVDLRRELRGPFARLFGDSSALHFPPRVSGAD